jgi:hypothetical protein
MLIRKPRAHSHTTITTKRSLLPADILDAVWRARVCFDLLKQIRAAARGIGVL